MTDVNKGLKFVLDYPDGSTGSSLVMDSPFTNVGAVVVIQLPSSELSSGSTGRGIENTAMSGVTTAVADTNDRSLLAALTRLGEWVLAPIYSTSVDATALWDYHVRVGGATGPDLTPTESARNSIYVAYGLLVESTGATWLYGTASEYVVMYQYNFHNAASVFAAMIQADSVGLFPAYSCAARNELSGCDASWAVVMHGCEDRIIAGAGLYSWFSAYAQDCIGGQLCQKAHEGAATTVNYPLMTASQDAWMSTITVRPMTLSKLGFEVMTIGGSNVKRDSGSLNRRAFEDFWPVPATTAAWPVVIDNGSDGEESTASPKAPYPTQPPSIKSGSPPPQNGAWPAKALRPRMAAAVDPNKELNDRLKDWMCRQAAESPSHYDMDMLEWPRKGWKQQRLGTDADG
ncbi:LysM domain-containing protein [Colletotrichum paranaense]|uniref:LysM domain-containing protein n=1 Tax=Colletotrichum paranaense TaxID=1914294 RepID=A0ABQ9SPB4_9PEZI|nr:LysM domain-containing protein [Colletotrichum paranaense]KAK1541347.1 LysM domain-containing protein [Colletotrichum paranaense]